MKWLIAAKDQDIFFDTQSYLNKTHMAFEDVSGLADTNAHENLKRRLQPNFLNLAKADIFIAAGAISAFGGIALVIGIPISIYILASFFTCLFIIWVSGMVATHALREYLMCQHFLVENACHYGLIAELKNTSLTEIKKMHPTLKIQELD